MRITFCRCRVSRDTILWRVDAQKAGVTSRTFECHASMEANLTVGEAGLEGADTVLQAQPIVAPDEDSVVQAALQSFPHLRGCTALRLAEPPSYPTLVALMQSQLCMCAVDDGTVNSATGMQIAGVLDSEYVPLPGTDHAPWAPEFHG